MAERSAVNGRVEGSNPSIRASLIRLIFMKKNNNTQNNNCILSQSVGDIVKSRRTRLGLTQTELAERLGTQQPSIARVESGKFLPSLIFLNKIATCLDIELTIKQKRVRSVKNKYCEYDVNG